MRKHLSVIALPISHVEAVRDFVIFHVKATTEHQMGTVDAARKMRSRGCLLKRTAEMKPVEPMSRPSADARSRSRSEFV
jgi:hypothetical protein